MRVAKYKAATMREALALAKREMGESAIILSTREVRRGVLGAGIEITAVTELETEAVEPPPPAAPAAGTAPPSLAEEDVERIMGPLRSELRALRTLLRSAPTEGNGIRQELTDLRRAVAEWVARADVAGAAAEPAGSPSLDEVARGTRLAAPSQGRVIALVGPTGAGKTTTVAKLAARAALVRGQRVGIITTDAYRVGGEEQLAIFAGLIPAPLYTASNRRELARSLAALRDADLVFIDTSGRSPRDRQSHVDLANTLSAVEELETHLVIPAPSSPSYVDRLCTRYQESLPIHRLLFTKLDEADDLTQLVRAPARLRLPISHITMGQAVPEDLNDTDDQFLLDLARNPGLLDSRAA